MRSTRRLLNRSPAIELCARSSIELLARCARSSIALLTFVVAGAVSSCGTDDGAAAAPDAGVAETDSGDRAPADAGDASAQGDAASFDGGPLPIVCAAPPCAVSLVTTRGLNADDRSEGFCALLDDGTVACWGANGAGQLGRGAEDLGHSATPARVAGISGAVKLDHTCAVDGSGGVSCWGTGAFPRNDAVAVTTERAPVKLALPPATSVGIGFDVGCAVVDDGVLCWGSNGNGQIAPFATVERSVMSAPRTTAVPSGAAVRDVIVGRAAFALRDDGVTVSWGASPSVGRLTSLVPDPYPVPITLRDISSIDLTINNACATALGVGYCWGTAVITPPFERRVPAPLATPEPVVQIATTRAYELAELLGTLKEPQRWCAVGASGTVYCWGTNAGGQAGDGTTELAREAVAVRGLPERAVQVKTMPSSTCALLTNGKVYCWGTNYYGQLGNGKLRVSSLVPMEVILP